VLPLRFCHLKRKVACISILFTYAAVVASALGRGNLASDLENLGRFGLPISN
jgi:hypothetical protein